MPEQPTVSSSTSQGQDNDNGGSSSSTRTANDDTSSSHEEREEDEGDTRRTRRTTHEQALAHEQAQAQAQEEQQQDPDDEDNDRKLPASETATGRSSSSNTTATTVTRKSQPSNKPTRPLSAYNLFFRDESQRIRDSQVPVQQLYDSEAASENVDKPYPRDNFQMLAKVVSHRWNRLQPDQKKPYAEEAKMEMSNYQVRLKSWQMQQLLAQERELRAQEQQKQEQQVAEEDDDEEDGSYDAPQGTHVPPSSPAMLPQLLSAAMSGAVARRQPRASTTPLDPGNPLAALFASLAGLSSASSGSGQSSVPQTPEEQVRTAIFQVIIQRLENASMDTISRVVIFIDGLDQNSNSNINTSGVRSTSAIPSFPSPNVAEPNANPAAIMLQTLNTSTTLQNTNPLAALLSQLGTNSGVSAPEPPRPHALLSPPPAISQGMMVPSIQELFQALANSAGVSQDDGNPTGNSSEQHDYLSESHASPRSRRKRGRAQGQAEEDSYRASKRPPPHQPPQAQYETMAQSLEEAQQQPAAAATADHHSAFAQPPRQDRNAMPNSMETLMNLLVSAASSQPTIHQQRSRAVDVGESHQRSIPPPQEQQVRHASSAFSPLPAAPEQQQETPPTSSSSSNQQQQQQLLQSFLQLLQHQQQNNAGGGGST